MLFMQLQNLFQEEMTMTLGATIAALRKQRGLTQEALAQKLEVTNQAVSKWESDQCCPDIQLLPALADIFGVTIDALFGRNTAPAEQELPWEDDDTLRVVLYAGRELLMGHPAQEELTFQYEGPALNIHSQINISCGDVQGNVTAGGNVNCDAVGSFVNANGNITCDDVSGSVTARGNVTCDDVDGSISAGGNITCDCVEGNASAGGNIRCDEINGSIVNAGGSIYCDHME